MNGPRPIDAVAQDLEIDPADLIHYGRCMAKVRLEALSRPARGEGALVLVSAMTPSRLGEGKTLTSVALAMGLSALGRRAAVCLREPSLGPVFGIKGGGTGGGRAQVEPAQEINLHFTGDLHAVTAANNLLAALVDNELHHAQGDLDPNDITWRRVLDLNDRALRRVVTGLGVGGVPRETAFDITAASEVMAILCLAADHGDLLRRLGRIVIGRTLGGDLVTADQLGAAGAMTALLKDALLPNLVQTSEGTPAFVHGGPFANIAHGCSSLVATRLAAHVADRVVTEAGFGFDLGGEKFLHIKCRVGGLWPHCVVVVASLRGLRLQGGASGRRAVEPSPGALRAGLPNLEQHLASVRRFGLEPVVSINVFDGDPEEELRAVEARCAELGVRAARCHGHAQGGEGALALAREVESVIASGPRPTPTFLYPLEAPYARKVELLAQALYGARQAHVSREARRRLDRFTRAGYGGLPVCVAKTPLSLTDDPRLRGRPVDFDVTVQDARLSAGAGFVVALLGEVQTMPGLPRRPSARSIRLEGDRVLGLMQGDGVGPLEPDDDA